MCYMFTRHLLTCAVIRIATHRPRESSAQWTMGFKPTRERSQSDLQRDFPTSFCSYLAPTPFAMSRQRCVSRCTWSHVSCRL